MTSGVLDGQQRLEVVVLRDGAADERAGRQRRAQPVDRRAGRLGGGVGVRHDLHERLAAGARHGGHHLRDARVGLGDHGDAGGVTLGGDDLHRAGSALAERLLDLVVADARTVTARDDLDRRHPGLQAEDRHDQRDENDQRERTERVRVAPEALAPGGEPRRAVLALVHPRQRELVDPRAELAEHRGQQRQRRGEDEEDGDHDPQRHRAERRRWHEHHGHQRDQHGHAAEQHGLAGGVHRLGDGVLDAAHASRTARRGSDRR